MKDLILTIDEPARCRMAYIEGVEMKRRYMFDAEWHAKVYEASLIVGALRQTARICALLGPHRRKQSDDIRSGTERPDA